MLIMIVSCNFYTFFIFVFLDCVASKIQDSIYAFLRNRLCCWPVWRCLTPTYVFHSRIFRAPSLHPTASLIFPLSATNASSYVTDTRSDRTEVTQRPNSDVNVGDRGGHARPRQILESGIRLQAYFTSTHVQ